MAGIVKLDTPITVNTLDWAFKHLGCNALVVRDNDTRSMTILAYAESKEYNNELDTLMDSFGNTAIFTNVDEDLLEVEKAESNMHKAYLLCKEVFDPSNLLNNNGTVADNEEEEQFRCIASNFFLQQRQKEIINR